MKYLMSDTDRHGNTRVYVRRPGSRKIRIRSAPGTLAFDREYLQAVKGELAPSPKRERPVFPPRPPKLGQVYFVKAGESIKIGFSVDVRRRVKNMQTAASETMTLLLVLPGTLADEKSMHDRFGHLRINGEWFKSGPDLVQFIRESRSRQNWKPMTRKAKSGTRVSHPN